MGGFRGAAFGVQQMPASSQQIGQALMGQGAAGAPMPTEGAAPGLLPTLGVGPVYDTGAHSARSTEHAMADATRRLEGMAGRESHTPRSPIVPWQLASLGVPRLEIDLALLTSGQRDADEADDMAGGMS